MVTRAVALAEMVDDNFERIKDSDYRKAKRLLEKFVEGKNDH